MPDNNNRWGNLLMNQVGGAASSLVGTGMGLLLEGHNDRRQLRQQQALTDMQIRANAAMSEIQQQNQLEMWEKTNYSAQIEQMNKAGLNPALLYGMGGGGGQTVGAGAAGVAAPSAPSGGREIMDIMNQRMQMQMTQSQIDLNKSLAEKNRAEIPNIAKTGQNIDASTAHLIQQAKTAAAQEELSQSITKFQNTVNEIQSATKEDAISKIKAESLQQWEVFDKLVRENQIGQETYNDLIKTIKLQAVKAYLDNEQVRAQTKLTKAETEAVAIKLLQGWALIDIQADQVATGKGELDIHDRAQKLMEKVHDVPESFKQATNIIKDVIGVFLLRDIFKRPFSGTPGGMGFKPQK